MSALLDSGSLTWDHGPKDIASDVDAMDSISSDFIEENWKNVEIIKFVFFNVMQTSNTVQAAINKIKANEDEFWGLMHPSDVAYAITGLVNNEDKWRAKWEKDQEKSRGGGTGAQSEG